MGTGTARTVRWRSLEGEGLEHLVLTETADGIVAEAVVIVPPGEGFAARYRIVCGPDWRVRGVEAGIVGLERRVLLESDGRGNWTRDGVPVPELAGALEPDLSITPFSNTFPVRRLNLAKGESADIVTAYVNFPDLAVSAHPQRYTCLVPGRLYRYESRDSDFCRDIETDEDGLVVNYPGLFRRIF
jgi:hypothetical protein